MQGGWQPPPGGSTGYAPPTPPPRYGGPPHGTAESYGNYEFSELENRIIDKCAGRTKLLGWVSIVVGASQLLGGACGAIASPIYAMYVPYGIVGLIVGITFLGVGSSLRSIVQSRGNDIGHLMQALEKLGGSLLIQSITNVVMLVVACLVALVMFFAVIAAAASH